MYIFFLTRKSIPRTSRAHTLSARTAYWLRRALCCVVMSDIAFSGLRKMVSPDELTSGLGSRNILWLAGSSVEVRHPS